VSLTAPFEPTDEAVQARLHAIRPQDYARRRNHLDGAVTRLSPYLTHGFLTLSQLSAHLRHHHGLHDQHKLVYELGWRAYFRHVWQWEGDGILRALHPGPLPDEAYASELPADIRQARTGLPVIDRAVAMLVEHGWLHNHARMWLASYIVHCRKVHWRAGADWMYAHLLDGDLASNHLSWQWVAGTASRKPYLFNAENVRRHAPPDWWIDGSALDADDDTLADIAADRRPWPMAHPASPPQAPEATSLGITAPLCSGEPPAGCFTPADAAQVAGKTVWLIHPWALRRPPRDWTGSAQDRLVLGVCDASFHARWPWSPRRWAFVSQRMQALSDHCWLDRAEHIVAALKQARSVTGWHDPHLGQAWSMLDWQTDTTPFTDPTRRCTSFSAWWTRVRLQVPDRADRLQP
jgi:deoxyribodipyrimidine photo-lyase